MNFINNTIIKGEFYLYQYIRLDKNEPFYIGVGKKYQSKTDYYRSKMSHKHNSICLSIINKTDYNIEILEESDDYTYIREREKELIKRYGRKCDNTGILSNFTIGGDGTIGNDRSYQTKKTYLYSKDGEFIKEFPSRKDIMLFLGVKGLTDKSLLKGYQVRNFKTEKISSKLNLTESNIKDKSKPIIQLTVQKNLQKISICTFFFLIHPITTF